MNTLKTMKALRFTFTLILVLLVFAFFSKSSAESGKVKHSNASNKMIDREIWKSLDYAAKLSAYQAFSHEKKQDFWRLKHNELKKLDWDSAELEHINSLYIAICRNPELMERGVGPEELEDQFEVFLYNWKEHARDVLGWGPKVIHAVSASGDEVLNTSGELKAFNASGVMFGYANTRSFNECDACREVPDGTLVPYPENCRAYFICVAGIAIAQLCPEGLLFDRPSGYCNWPGVVICDE